MKNIENFFLHPTHPTHKQYEALRALYVEKRSPKEVAKRLNYSIHTIRAIKRDFDAIISTGQIRSDWFFLTRSPGRKRDPVKGSAKEKIIRMRKQYYSVLDIKTVLDSEGITVSHDYIHRVLKAEGFGRLPKRTQREKRKVACALLKAPRSQSVVWADEIGKTYYSEWGVGILPFLPLLASLRVDEWIRAAGYPATRVLSNTQNILSFIALKLSGCQRFSHDDLWAMDRAIGLFSGLNVLPKDTTLSTYSYRITRSMNRAFLKSMWQTFQAYGIGRSINLDFTAIPHWGDESVLQTHWSGKRGKRLKSILALLCQDPDSGLFCYGDAELRRERQPECVLEFLDFWREGGNSPVCLVFDSKFTTYHQLERLDQDQVKFITLRRRGKQLIERFEQVSQDKKQRVRIEIGDRKYKTLTVYESEVLLPRTQCVVRQIVVSDNGRQKPAFIITNDRERTVPAIIRQYSRRWNVEKGISEQIEFFHLNRLSSSIVVKVDFDLTMTLACHNFYRMMAQRLVGFETETSMSLHHKFFHNGGKIQIQKDKLMIYLKKKRHLPILMHALKPYEKVPIPWLGDRIVQFKVWSTS
jgi:transposase